MKTSLKQLILGYIETHNDNSEIANELISELKREIDYADVDCFSISRDDIDDLSDSAKEKLEKHFGKPVSKFSTDEYQDIADAMANLIAEEYGENLYNTIEYEL